MPPIGHQRYGPQFEDANHRQQQPYFQYSQCNGKKKALCVSSIATIICSDDDPDSGLQIGINYFRQPAELKGCINDARNIERFLTSQLVYPPSSF